MGMESIRQERYPHPSKKAIKNRLLWVCENRRQEKYPEPSKDKKRTAQYTTVPP